MERATLEGPGTRWLIIGLAPARGPTEPVGLLQGTCAGRRPQAASLLEIATKLGDDQGALRRAVGACGSTGVGLPCMLGMWL